MSPTEVGEEGRVMVKPGERLVATSRGTKKKRRREPEEPLVQPENKKILPSPPCVHSLL